ncbi:MAG: hypothetical protein MK207_10045 [Saprospiraceae bacterium]|nr:hypothetical protein [Saprospiraceae bacterium]
MESRSFTTGIFFGAVCVLLLLLLVSFKTINENNKRYEFHDLKDTRGIIFDTATGKIKYTEIRTSLPNDEQQIYVVLSGDLNTYEQN